MGRKRPDYRAVDEYLKALEPFRVNWSEAEVAVLLMQDGATDKEMAASLGIGERAVQKRLRLLREKLGVEDRGRLRCRVCRILGRRARRPQPDEGREDENRISPETATP